MKGKYETTLISALILLHMLTSINTCVFKWSGLLVCSGDDNNQMVFDLLGVNSHYRRIFCLRILLTAVLNYHL